MAIYSTKSEMRFQRVLDCQGWPLSPILFVIFIDRISGLGMNYENEVVKVKDLWRTEKNWRTIICLYFE